MKNPIISLLRKDIEVETAIPHFLRQLIIEHEALIGSCWWALPNYFCVLPENNAFVAWQEELHNISMQIFEQVKKESCLIIEQNSFLDQPLHVITYVLQHKEQVLGVCSFVTENRQAHEHEDCEVIEALSIYLWEQEVRVRLRTNRYEVINGLSSIVEALDPYTSDHSKNVANYALMFAEELNLPPHIIEQIYYGALFHDIGKVGIPIDILQKQDKLDPKEFEVIKCHPEKSATILENFTDFIDVVPIVRHHHEFFNGSGYPDGLKGEDIPLGARVVSVVDAFDVITTNRSYDAAEVKTIALKKIHEAASKQFDPKIVEVFMWVAESL